MKCAYAVDGFHGVDGKVGSRIRDVVALHHIGAAGVVVLDGNRSRYPLGRGKGC